MTDRPILFSAPMVRALLDGRKTQTRRILKDVPAPPSHDNVVHLPPKHEAPYFDAYCGGKRTDLNPRGMTDHWCWWTRDDRQSDGCKLRFVPGDRLWVKETWTIGGVFTDCVETRYRAHERRSHTEFVEQVPINRVGKLPKARWPRYASPLHMPRWASRITLTVTDVRVERLQDISNDDAFDEGVEEDVWDMAGVARDYSQQDAWFVAWSMGINPPNTMVDEDRLYIESYRTLWDSINGKGSWDANPWVAAISFDVRQGNIDG